MDRPEHEQPDQPDAPQSEATAPDATPPDGTPPARRNPLVILGAALAVIALVAGIAWFTVSTSAANRERAIREAATGYLTAIGASDADTALGHVAEAPANRALLTDEVLQASNQAAPLTQVEVTRLSGEGEDATVEVSYLLGDRPIETALTLTGNGRTDWKVADGLVDLTSTEIRALTVNGATLTEQTNPVFPGSYTAAPTTDRVAVSGEPTVLVTTPDQPGAQLNVTVGLSDAGRAAVVGAVRTRFEECLASTESRPANCPFGVSTEGVELTPGSVRFTLNGDPWPGVNPALDPATMTAGGTFPFSVTATATVTLNGLTTEATTPLNAERGYSVDLTQDPLLVTWQ